MTAILQLYYNNLPNPFIVPNSGVYFPLPKKLKASKRVPKIFLPGVIILVNVSLESVEWRRHKDLLSSRDCSKAIFFEAFHLFTFSLVELIVSYFSL